LIDEIRPEWVVIENVRGLLYTDAATSGMEWCEWCVGDPAHRHPLRALGAVLGGLAELGWDAEWCGLRAADVGAPHGRFRLFVLAWPLERTGRDPDRPLVPLPAAYEELRLLPTPEAKLSDSGPDYARAERAERGDTGGDDLVTAIWKAALDDWGPYAAAVARWEGILGRPAPPPVRDHGSGRDRLNPALTEWMMGWPEGWVTDPVLGLTATEQRRVCGNGVVTAQAAAALRHLLSRPGVPDPRHAAPAIPADVEPESNQWRSS
jgi:DNA (cytosine-5)-methyltransferase 1